MSRRLSLPKDQLRIALLEGVHERARTVLEDEGYHSIELLPGALPREELASLLENVHVVGIRSRTKLDAELLTSARRLFAVACFCIGTDQVDLGVAAQRGIPVFNAPHSNTRSVAELVLGLSVMLFRGIFEKSVAAHAGRWLKSAAGSREVRGKTLGIIGYGHIGTQVSVLAEALGLRVLFHDVVPRLPLGNARPVQSLAELLETADIVSLHVPDEESTRGMIGAEELARMSPRSFLINTSRGQVVDVDALADALRREALGGAAIDVFPREPHSRAETFESPLCGIERVILTPHIGGSTLEAQENIAVEVANRITSYSDRGTTLGAVNFPELGLEEHAGCSRVLHIHENRPGMMRRINHVFADLSINIVAEHLQTRGEIGYVVVDVEPIDQERVLHELRALEGTIRARVLY